MFLFTISSKVSWFSALFLLTIYSSAPSGGTLNTVLSLMDTWSLKDIAAAHAPGGISPIPVPKAQPYKSIITKIFGFRSVSDLGILTSSLGGTADRPIVYRSWALLGGDKSYGPNFHFSEYMKARNYLGAIAIHFGLMIGSMLLAIPLFRTIARKYVYKPGEGPTREQYKNDRVEYRGIGVPDVQTPNPPRAFCRVKYEGSLYACEYPTRRGASAPACLGFLFVLSRLRLTTSRYRSFTSGSSHFNSS